MIFAVSNERRMGANTPGLRRTADESHFDIVYVSTAIASWPEA